MDKCIEEILTEGYDFGREVSPLSFSCTKINCETAADSVCYGSFYIMGDAGARGIVETCDLRFSVNEGSFSGAACEIPYTVSSRGLKPGAVKEGTIRIISNRGEYELPYEIRVKDELPVSSMGPIRNLFHFTNLAMSSWDEALELFYSPSFKKILNGPDAVYLTGARAFRAVYKNPLNMERFLQYARKKTEPEMVASVDEIKLEPDAERGSFSLVRDGWGYTEVGITTDAPFIELSVTELTSDDFKDGEAFVDFDIIGNALHGGKNEGVIKVMCGGIKLDIPVSLMLPAGKPDIKEQKLMLSVSKMYIDFRIGRLSRTDFCRDAALLISPFLSADPERADLRLFRAHILLLERRGEEAGRMLEAIAALPALKEAPELMAYGLYLRSLYLSDPIIEETLSDEVDDALKKDDTNWRLAWFALYMRDEYKNDPAARLELIRRLYDSGCRSPFILLEAVHIFLDDPKMMDHVLDFEIDVMRFALRFKITGSELRRRFALLTLDIHSYSPNIERLLTECMELSGDTDVLEALCTHLMRGNCIDGRYFKWYALAVEKEIRLTRLYEYYMLSIDREYTGTLPKAILMYFAYRSNLDAGRTAFLYANVLRHRNEYSSYSDIVSRYDALMTDFAKEQLAARNYDENLALLYERLLDPYSMGDEYANAWVQLLFTERIECLDDTAVSLILIYDHMEGEEVYPLIDGKTVVPVFGNRASFFTEDREGNRREADKVLLRKRISGRHFDENEYMKVETPEAGPALFITESDGSISVNADNERFVSWLALNGMVNEEYTESLMVKLAGFYFDNDMIALLDELLLMFDQTKNFAGREEILKIMIARGMYDEAFLWLKNCGTEGVDIKIILRLADRILERDGADYDRELYILCREILASGKYDEEVLEYMLRFHEGSIKDKKELWRAADSFSLATGALVEDIIRQMLFTGQSIKERDDIFSEYAKTETDLSLECALLSFVSYEVLHKGTAPDPLYFERIPYADEAGGPVTVYMKLAFIRYAAGLYQNGRDNKRIKECAFRFMDSLLKQDIFLPDYLTFMDEKPELKIYDGSCFATYAGDMNSRVILHYVALNGDEDSEDYRKEEMRHVYGGLYIRPFILFNGEKTGYYVTEENGRQEKLTKANVLEAPVMPVYREKGRFGMINEMAGCLDKADEKGFFDAASVYLKSDAVSEKLFDPEAFGRERI